MNVQQLGQQVIQECRRRGWAALETGISRPVPVVVDGQVRLNYLLYRSQVRVPHQLLFEPFMRVVVDYQTGAIVAHDDLPTSDPPRVLGRFPHAEAARIPPDEWPKVWDELFSLYPDVIDAFTGRAAPDQREKVRRFIELWELTTPPFFNAAYRALNPAFYDWLNRARG